MPPVSMSVLEGKRMSRSAYLEQPRMKADIKHRQIAFFGADRAQSASRVW
jgi:hypothetical protein